MGGEPGYEKLLVWKKAEALALAVYQATKNFPREELYGITSQLRRAVLSVPTNIVEGSGRQGKKERKQFVNVALGSLAETGYLLGFSQRLGCLSETSYSELENQRKSVGALLWNFYQSL